jgi:predicted metal-dependent HD superfamily phosphohydrolase
MSFNRFRILIDDIQESYRGSIDSKISRDVIDYLRVSYSEKYRHYHSFNHIVYCLHKLDWIKKENWQLHNPDLMEFSLWFHDVIYTPGSIHNEEASADKAYFDYIRLGGPINEALYIKNLILLTTHTSEATNWDQKFMVDIDLSILGEDEHVYNLYQKGIEKEYRVICLEEEYIKGRKKFLEKMLTKKYIYSTIPFKDNYEVRARENMEKELSKL